MMGSLIGRGTRRRPAKAAIGVVGIAVNCNPGRIIMEKAGKKVTIEGRLKIEERREGTKATLVLSGRLTVSDSPCPLKETAATLAARGVTHVVFDLADVRYIDSACLGEFIASQISLGRRGARLQLTRVPDRIMELLKLSGLDGIFEIV